MNSVYIKSLFVYVKAFSMEHAVRTTIYRPSILRRNILHVFTLISLSSELQKLSFKNKSVATRRYMNITYCLTRSF